MPLTNQLYKKVEELAINARKEFQSKGIVIPTKEKNGSIKFNNYTVIKSKNGFYTILNYENSPVVEQINLPQTAILLANNLALGKWVDNKILDNDKQYGYSSFEEQQCKRVAKIMIERQDWIRFDAALAKESIARIKAEKSKHAILISFEKLRRLR